MSRFGVRQGDLRDKVHPSTVLRICDRSVNGRISADQMVSGSNVNGTVVVNGNSNNNSPNLRISYNGGYSPGGKGLVIDAVGYVDARRAHMNLKPFSVAGTARVPDTEVANGDLFATSDYSPSRLYYYNGNSCVQAA